MSQDPPLEGKPLIEQLAYNRFGRWVRALNDILDTTLEEVAQMIGYNKGSFSVATRGDGGMNRQTFNALLQAYQTLSVTRDVKLPVTWQLFLALAWIGEEANGEGDLSVVKGAAEALEQLEWLAEVMKQLRQVRKENELLTRWKYKRDMRETVNQLEMENRELLIKAAWLEALLKEREQRESGNS